MNKRRFANLSLLALPGIAFIIFALPTLIPPGLPATYDLPDHFHFSLVFLNQSWDNSWAAGYPTTSYVPMAYFLGGIVAKIFGNDTTIFKLFFALLFLPVIYTSYLIAGKICVGQRQVAVSTVLYALSPALLLAYVYGWYTSIVSLIFFNCFVYSFLKQREGRTLPWIAVSILSIAISVNSEVYSAFAAVALIFAYILYDFWKRYLHNKLDVLQQVEALKNIRSSFLILVAAAACSLPAALPFLSFISITGPQKEILNLSRGDIQHNFFNNVLKPAGPAILILTVLAISTFFIFRGGKESVPEETTVVALLFTVILVWFALGPSVSPLGLIGYGDWLTYDRFLLFALPMLVPLAVRRSSLVLTIRSSKLSKKTVPLVITVGLTVIICLAGIAGIITATQTTQQDLGYSYGSTYQIPSQLIDYFSNQSSSGDWGRIITLGLPYYYANIPDLTGIPIIDMPYATARLLPFMRQSGIDDFNDAKYFNGTSEVQYVMNNYQFYGIRWIVVGDAYYNQFIPAGRFQQVLQIPADRGNLTVYESLSSVQPLSAYPDQLSSVTTPENIAIMQNATIGTGGGAQSVSLAQVNGGLALAFQTNGTFGWGFVALPFQYSSNSSAKDLYLSIEVRSPTSGSLGVRIAGINGTVNTFMSNGYLGSGWQSLSFKLNSRIENSTLFLSVGGNGSEELDISDAIIGYPVYSVSFPNPQTIVIQRSSAGTSSSVILKEAYYPSWSASNATLADDNGLMNISISNGVSFVVLHFNDTMHQVAIASSLGLITTWFLSLGLALLWEKKLRNNPILHTIVPNTWSSWVGKSKASLSVCMIAPYLRGSDLDGTSRFQYEGHGIYAKYLARAIDRIRGIRINLLDLTSRKAEENKWKFPFDVSYVRMIIRGSAQSDPDILHLERFSYSYFTKGLNLVVLPIALFFISLKHKIMITFTDIVPLLSLKRDFLDKFSIRFRFPLILKVGILLATSFLSRVTDAFVVQTTYDKDVLVYQYKIKKEKVHVIPLGEHDIPIILPIEDAKAKLGLSGKQIILYFGHLAKYKGIECLIEAYGQLKHDFRAAYYMILAGGPHIRLESDYLKELGKIAAKFKVLDSLLFTGFVESDEIPIYFSAADIVVLPYLFYPGASGALRYAFQYGKPVITTTPVAYAEALVDKIDAIVVPPANSDLLSRAIANLLQSEVIRTKFSSKARERTHSVDDVAQLYFNLYSFLLQDKRVPSKVSNDDVHFKEVI